MGKKKQDRGSGEKKKARHDIDEKDEATERERERVR